MQRVFLIHGWGGSPNNDWLPWAKEALEKSGYDVFIPEMPDTEHPKITPWVEKLKETVGIPKPNDILIGHSIGCQTILRYIEKLDDKQRVGKVILVAPWWYLTLDENEEQADADPWLKLDVNFEKIKTKADKFICVFSQSDPWVPYSKNVEFFKRNLNPEIVTKNGPGHFTSDEGADKIEFLLDLIK